MESKNEDFKKSVEGFITAFRTEINNRLSQSVEPSDEWKEVTIHSINKNAYLVQFLCAESTQKEKKDILPFLNRLNDGSLSEDKARLTLTIPKILHKSLQEGSVKGLTNDDIKKCLTEFEKQYKLKHKAEDDVVFKIMSALGTCDATKVAGFFSQAK